MLGKNVFCSFGLFEVLPFCKVETRSIFFQLYEKASFFLTLGVFHLFSVYLPVYEIYQYPSTMKEHP